MLTINRILFTLLTSLAFVFSSASFASSTGEQKQVFGDYEVHYMGLTSSFLKPEVAAAYGIERSRSIGYLSISILHKDKNQPMHLPVAGKVTGTIKNLIGQSRELSFKEVREQDAVYYISTFKFDDEDMYTLNLKVTPEHQARTLDVKFSQRFYHE